ncbi:MAG: DUF5317 family protein [Acidimicrobiales bacterium]
MLTLVLAAVAGLIVGLARSPAGVHTVRPRVEHVGLLAVGAGLNALAVLLDGTASLFALIASLAVLIAVAVANRHITGVAVVGCGLLLNLVSVAVNGGMPVRASALEAAGVISEGQPVEVEDPRHLETAADPIPVLGDVLPVPLTNEVLSFGDLIVIVGAADAVRELSRRRARPLSVAVAQRPIRTASASVDQVWGTAPSGAPVSATQCSANPEASAPETIDLISAEPAASDPALVAASQSR